LVGLDNLTVKEIEEISGVHREEIYRKIKELEKLGFVERVLKKPLQFRAAPLESVLKTLLHQKSEEIAQLQLETEEMIQNKLKKKNETLNEKTNEIRLIPENRPLLKRSKEQLSKSTKNLNVVCSWNKGISWMSSHHKEFLKAIERGVKIRFILEKNENYSIPTYVEKLKAYSCFDLKIISHNPCTVLALFDEETVMIDTSSSTSFVKSPAIWSNNSCLIGLAKIYFEKMWTDSTSID
jgi:sugar-specific transcriptional regulator TrmB